MGTGYVGLVAGAGFAEFGNDVICVDINAERIASLQRGQVPIYEPGLEEVIKRNSENGRLQFSTDTGASVGNAEVIFIAIGTPSGEDGSADLAHILAATKSIAKGLLGPSIVVTKSTVPIGTGDRIEAVLREHTKHEVSVVSNPEFLKEGDALNDFMKPSRIILGCNDEAATQKLERLYSPFVRTNSGVMKMDRYSAEMTKYAANAMLATRISFMNELSHLASAVGADIESVRRGIGSDPRIGNKFLFAGAGYGGSCFPKDTRALLMSAADHDVPLEIVAAAQLANMRQKTTLLKMVQKELGESLHGKRIAQWGLSFKPHTDDVRESAAIATAQMLVQAGATVVAFDPEAQSTAELELGASVTYAGNMYAAAESADALVLVTEWPCFRRPDFKRLNGLMRGRNIFDGRNIWTPADVRRNGFSYFGIGRPEAR
jgi:UDPglucose 6-dehydrogenase